MAPGTVVPVNVYECFTPSSVNFQPAIFTGYEPLFVIFTVSPCRSRAVIDTEPDDAGTELRVVTATGAAVWAAAVGALAGSS